MAENKWMGSRKAIPEEGAAKGQTHSDFFLLSKYLWFDLQLGSEKSDFTQHRFPNETVISVGGDITRLYGSLLLMVTNIKKYIF